MLAREIYKQIHSKAEEVKDVKVLYADYCGLRDELLMKYSRSCWSLVKRKKTWHNCSNSTNEWSGCCDGYGAYRSPAGCDRDVSSAGATGRGRCLK